MQKTGYVHLRITGPEEGVNKVKEEHLYTQPENEKINIKSHCSDLFKAMYKDLSA